MLIISSTGSWIQSSGTPSNSCFSTLKDIQRKFPLRAACQYSYPLLQPPRSYCHKSVHHSLIGNCLDVVEVGGEATVVHVDPSTDNQQAVIASRLVQGRYYQKDQPISADPFFHLEKQYNVLQDQNVYQIVSKSLDNDVHVLVRSPTTVHLAVLGQAGFVIDKQETLDGLLTSDAAVSHLLPGLWSLVTLRGQVTLHDAEARKPIWMTHYRESKKFKNESASTFRCDFGRHPLHLFVGNETSLRFYDMRMHSDEYRSLFDIKNKYVFDKGHICSFVPSNEQPHFYLVMDECVYVVDDRQPKTPLMYWRHMLQERPTLSTLHRLGSLEILMLSCTQSKEVCMISSKWEGGRQQCQGVSLPRHFPILRDTANFAHSHSLWFTNQVQERLEGSAWLGTATLPHPAQNGSLLFLSLHNSGDIFSHSFQTLHLKDNSAINLEDQQGEAILSQWEKDVVEVSTHSWSSQNVKCFDVTGFFNQVLNKPSARYVEEMLAGLPEVKFNHMNGSTNSMGIKGSSKTDKNKQISTNCEKSAKSCHKKDNKGEISADCNEKESLQKIGYIWNLREQIQTCKSRWISKSKGCAAWNYSLMENYVIDPILDPSVNLPITGAITEDSLSKFLPRSIITDLKMNKIKNCDDFLSSKIQSLWLGENNSNNKKEETKKEGYGASDSRLSNLIGIPTSTRKHGFQYHTAPVDLSDVSASLTTSSHHVRDEQSPEPPESSHPSEAIQESKKEPIKSKDTFKKIKKRKRVDGF